MLLDELAHTLGYSKFAGRIESLGTNIAALVAQYTALVSPVMPASVPRVVTNDAMTITSSLRPSRRAQS